jgi:hypothetical protein
VTPVAILGSTEFDVESIDVSTARLGPDDDDPATEGAAPVRDGSLEDVNVDGLVDLVLHFRTQDIGLSNSDTDAVLTGRTDDDPPRDIEGTDSVRIVPGSSRGVRNR